MHKVKNVFKNILTTYDDILYFFWRSITEGAPKKHHDVRDDIKVSLVVPVYNTDIYFLEVMINSVINQLYPNWELILVDDASPETEVRKALQKFAEKDKRIKVKLLKENKHIAGATNIGISLATGDYVGLLDHDDVLHTKALNEIVRAVHKNPAIKFIYTDEDKIVGEKRIQPFFKPSWNLGLLYCVNYITHFSVIKKETLDKVGYEESFYNGAQDWELFLRVARNVEEAEIVHIPKILYSWRMHENSTSVSLDAKPYVVEAQINAVKSDLRARDMNDVSVKRNDRYPGQLEVSYGRRKIGLNVSDLVKMLGLSRTLFILVSSRMALSRHVYRTASYDKIK